MSKNKPDPKLKEAVKEIVEVCKKYDCGGLIILSSRDHGEYLIHFPDWSKCFLEDQPEGKVGIRFRAKGKDEDKTIRDTVHMLQVFQTQSFQWSQGLDQLLEMLESKMIITGGPKKL